VTGPDLERLAPLKSYAVHIKLLFIFVYYISIKIYVSKLVVLLRKETNQCEQEIEDFWNHMSFE
jgi:hypothetical protein